MLPSGKCISATAKVEDYKADAKNNQQLEVTARVADKDEAKALAEKLLRKHNRYAKTATFYFAKQVSTEIADVLAASPTPGVVKLYVLMGDGELANEEIKNKVLAACSADEVRPLTDRVFVEDAEVVSI